LPRICGFNAVINEITNCGGDEKSYISRSIPLRVVFPSIETIDAIAIFGFCKRGLQLYVAPPIDNITFLPYDCHLDTKEQG
jgi:hypothetical protein